MKRFIVEYYAETVKGWTRKSKVVEAANAEAAAEIVKTAPMKWNVYARHIEKVAEI